MVATPTNQYELKPQQTTLPAQANLSANQQNANALVTQAQFYKFMQQLLTFSEVIQPGGVEAHEIPPSSPPPRQSNHDEVDHNGSGNHDPNSLPHDRPKCW